MYQQAVKCIAADTPPSDYDVIFNEKSSGILTAGQEINDYVSCDMPGQWSLLQFEAIIVIILIASVGMIRWRRGMLQL